MACVPIIPVLLFARPERIFINLKKLLRRRSVLTSAEHHRAEPPVTNGQCVSPPYSRLVVPKNYILRTGILLDTASAVRLARERKCGGGY